MQSAIVWCSERAFRPLGNAISPWGARQSPTPHGVGSRIVAELAGTRGKPGARAGAPSAWVSPPVAESLGRSRRRHSEVHKETGTFIYLRLQKRARRFLSFLSLFLPPKVFALSFNSL